MPKILKIHSAEPPRLELARLPTPLDKPERLASCIGIDRLMIKRDDVTGLKTSGNKIRKLEYVVAHAREAGADTLVTVGGLQSNHCRATAAVAARLGMRSRLLLRAENSPTSLDGNLLLDALFGAEISFHPPDQFGDSLDDLVNQTLDELRNAGHQPCYIPMGASTPLGSWGYVRCLKELADVLGQDSVVDVYCATGSAGTQVGLMLGKALFGCEQWRIVGVPVCESAEYFRCELRQLERKTVEQYSLDLSESMTPIHLIDGFIGEGYGIPYSEAIEMVHTCARQGGFLLDPVYTSKAFAGMVSTIHAGKSLPGATTVFLHTGGVFGLMAKRELFAQSAEE